MGVPTEESKSDSKDSSILQDLGISDFCKPVAKAAGQVVGNAVSMAGKPIEGANKMTGAVVDGASSAVSGIGQGVGKAASST